MEYKFVNVKSIFDKYKAIYVPYYQRDYVWGQKNNGRNLYKFINDIFTQYNENASSDYFIGTLAFCSSRVNDVIDGQQRVTSLVLILTILSEKCSDEIKETNKKLLYPEEDKFVLQEEFYLTEEIKFALHLPNRYNSQQYGVNISQTVDKIRNQIEKAWGSYEEAWYDGLYNYILNKVKFISLEYSNISESLKYFLNINSLSIQLTQSDIFFSILSQSIRISESTFSIFTIKRRIEELSKMQGMYKDIEGYKAYDAADKGVDNIIYIFLNSYYQSDPNIVYLDETGVGKWMSYYRNDVFNNAIRAQEFTNKFMDYITDLEFLYQTFTNVNSTLEIKSSLYTSWSLLQYENYFDILKALQDIFKLRHNYIDGKPNLYKTGTKDFDDSLLNEIAKRLNLTIIGNYIKSSNKRLDSFITNISIDLDNNYKVSIDDIVDDIEPSSIFNLNYNDDKGVSNAKIKNESRIIKVIFALQESFLNLTATPGKDINDYFKDILLTNNFSIEHLYSVKEWQEQTRKENWQSKKHKFADEIAFDTERFKFENLSLLNSTSNSAAGAYEIKDKLAKYKTARKVLGSEWEYLIMSLVDDSEYYKNENIQALGLPDRRILNIDQNTWEHSQYNKQFNTELLKLSLKEIANK